MEGPVMVYHPDRHSESAASTEQHIVDCARRLNEIFDVLKTQRRSFLMTSASTGSVEMILEREGGKLKIKYFRRIARISTD